MDINEYIPSYIKPNENPNALGTTIIVYLDPKTRAVENIISWTIFMTSEYDPKAAAWVPLKNEDADRLYYYSNNYASYIFDWDNAEAFDENDKSIVLKKYSDGTLTEEDLKKYCTYGGEAPTGGPVTEADLTNETGTK